MGSDASAPRAEAPSAGPGDAGAPEAGAVGWDGRPPSLRASLARALASVSTMLPIMLGIALLIGLLQAAAPEGSLGAVFTGEPVRDTLVAAAIGSVSAGSPVNSYIIGGELLKRGVGVAAVAAFIVSWVTVGVVQFPAEAAVLGRRFALARNATGFVLALAVGAATALALGAMG